MPVVPVRLPAPLRAAAEREAERTGTSVSAVIRAALAAHVAEGERRERHRRFVAALELAETYPRRARRPLPDMSAVWAAARRRAG